MKHFTISLGIELWVPFQSFDNWFDLAIKKNPVAQNLTQWVVRVPPGPEAVKYLITSDSISWFFEPEKDIQQIGLVRFLYVFFC